MSSIKHVLQKYRFFPGMSLIRLCAAAGLTSILSLISSQFRSRFSAYASLRFFFTCLSISGLFIFPFAFLRLSNRSLISSRIHSLCCFLATCFGMFSSNALLTVSLKFSYKIHVFFKGRSFSLSFSTESLYLTANSFLLHKTSRSKLSFVWVSLFASFWFLRWLRLEHDHFRNLLLDMFSHSTSHFDISAKCICNQFDSLHAHQASSMFRDVDVVAWTRCLQ